MSKDIQKAFIMISLGQPYRIFTQCLYPCRNLFFLSEEVKVSNMLSLKDINTKMQVLNGIWIATIVRHSKPGHVKLQRKVDLWVDLSNALGVFNSWIQGYSGIDKIFIRLNFNLTSYHCKDENSLILCCVHNKAESWISGVSEHFLGDRLSNEFLNNFDAKISTNVN